MAVREKGEAHIEVLKKEEDIGIEKKRKARNGECERERTIDRKKKGYRQMIRERHENTKLPSERERKGSERKTKGRKRTRTSTREREITRETERERET